MLAGNQVVQGIGGAGMPTIESIIVSDIVPQKDRGLWQGFINLVFTLGCASGSLLGSLIAELIGWRWVFLTQVPLCLFAVILCTTFLELPVSMRGAISENQGDHNESEQPSWIAGLQRLDYLGMILLAASVASLIFGLQHGGGVAWDSQTTITWLAVALMGFLLYLTVEAYVAVEPITPLRLLFSRELLPPYLCTLFSFAAWMAVLFYMPLFFQARYDEDIRISATRLLLAQLGVLVGSFGVGWATRRTGKYYWITVLGYVWFTGSLVFAIIGMTHEDPVMVMLAGALVGVGTGSSIVTSILGLSKQAYPLPPFPIFDTQPSILCTYVMPLTSLSSVTNASNEDMATVTAINYLMRSIGSAIGVSVASTVVQNSLRWGISSALELDKGQSEFIADRARKDLLFIDTLPETIQLVVRTCYGIAVRDSTIAVLGMTVLALISSFFFREKRLSG